jgi:hypothetical protein
MDATVALLRLRWLDTPDALTPPAPPTPQELKP